jgi:hypothetical protein
MPVEFSVAAYRFGHSMVRANYALNNATVEPNEVPIFDPRDKDNDLRGFRVRPGHRQIEWFRFFNLPGLSTEENLQVARAFDTQLVHGLGGLPTKVATNPSSLAARNLLRGKALGLPSGQAVARAMGIPESLIIGAGKPFQIGTGYTFKGKPDPSAPQIDKQQKEHLEAVFGQQTPLWYYILKEAEFLQHGKTLGPVGGRIVAEVFIGLLWGDPRSFINVWPGWQPHQGKFGCLKDGAFTVADLLRYVQSRPTGA